MAEAFAVRATSDDPKARVVPQSGVGAVIVGPAGEIARSANVLPPSIRGQAGAQRGVEDTERYFVIEHAERAAIFSAFLSGKSMVGSTIYCTRFPCSDCARAILWAGIGRAVFPGGFSGEVRWIDAQRAALRMLREGGVRVRYLSKFNSRI